VYLRGLAYLSQRNAIAAAAEFQNILDHRGRMTNCSLGALAHFQLGRAFALAGDKANAQAAFQAFLTLWSDADPGTAIQHEAQTANAKLQ
jgi:hypothetical protein